MENSANMYARGVLENKSAVVLYFAVLLVLIIIIVWNLKSMSSAASEHYYGYGAANTFQSVVSGPDVRFASQLTGTNQGINPNYIIDVKQNYPGYVAGGKERLMNKRKKERLTSTREPPVFYDISQMLSEYQYASQFDCADGSSPLPIKTAMGGLTYACADGSTPTGFVAGSNPSDSGATGVDNGTDTAPSNMSTAEFATGSPGAAVQEALLQRQLGY